MKGWVSKSSACPLKPRENNIFRGISKEFCRDIPGVPEKFENREFVFNSSPHIFPRFSGNFVFVVHFSPKKKATHTHTNNP